jgi:NAD(P)-dependent dehydrogenase (short-subunit alcohol dehydrogenase family)
MEITGLPIIVTGGGSGMGAETAKTLANLGAKVAVLDINQSAVGTVANEIDGIGLQCDVTSEESVKTALKLIIEKIGAPRVCVNCAGIIVGSRLVSRQGPMSLEDFRRCIDVNLIGTFNVMRLVSEIMMPLEPLNEDGERGVMINTSSIAAFEGQIGQVAYSASKGGVAAMTLPVARELAKFGIRVVAVAPGLIETPMLTNMPPDAQKSLVETTVFPKRLGKPSEFANFIAHIIQNLLLNGEIVRLDGAVRLTAK